MKYTPVGVDIAKHLIQVHFIDENTGDVVDKQLRREIFWNISATGSHVCVTKGPCRFWKGICIRWLSAVVPDLHHLLPSAVTDNLFP